MRLAQVKGHIPRPLFDVLAGEISTLRPCQEKAIRAGLLKGKNLLVCTPTASGKTLLAEIAGIKRILEVGQKCVYIVPLKALAMEKYKDFKAKYAPLGVKIALSIGDLDSSDPWLANFDLVITTSEKMDSLIRHGAPWVSQVGVAVFDEIHLLNDPGRGPTLEILVTLLKKLLPSAQFIALSATVGNPVELAGWLGADAVLDDWRPVKLYQGIFESGEIDFFGAKGKLKVIAGVDDPVLGLALDTIKKGKQALIFCPTKKSAEATADRLARLLPKDTSLPSLSKGVLSALSSPTRQCRRLAFCVEHGMAFHHAGLVSKQRGLIEDEFRAGKIKIICATPTLAFGVNLPAFRVIMKSLKRYAGRWGQTWIPVLEYHQMTGRAGRP